ncbi:hypothetical protein GLAREA_04596 [Glarea lozoyensis ATCC 20868]|uniref:Uncharacterized protein n=1 Tax=Glarea lozoyensis (strain ATCC 20868 / MF5171) TaxID=1116229 RepID=S3CQ45_GLAL2|nr:uncharacterized protein GLAREA_04596 [Glarea lozoyensis ATCC 20868]EPE27805.1 hypothetical protein GLAREA_04596 [Glarea lozoyensis ATCC 20868]
MRLSYLPVLERFVSGSRRIRSNRGSESGTDPAGPASARLSLNIKPTNTTDSPTTLTNSRQAQRQQSLQKADEQRHRPSNFHLFGFGMTSKAYLQSGFLDRTTTLSGTTPPDLSTNPRKALEDAKTEHKREASVYDAVAGRVSSHGFISKYAAFSSARDTTSSSATAAAPENVLFRRKHAPQRFAEHDIYFANDRQSAARDLPESDLLKALHCYASDYYSRTHNDVVDWRSMDETALIALGVLMEEATRLEQTEDFVLTEGQLIDRELPSETRVDRHIDAELKPNKRPTKKRRIVKDHTSDNSNSEYYDS